VRLLRLAEPATPKLKLATAKRSTKQNYTVPDREFCLVQANPVKLEEDSELIIESSPCPISVVPDQFATCHVEASLQYPTAEPVSLDSLRYTTVNDTPMVGDDYDSDSSMLEDMEETTLRECPGFNEIARGNEGQHGYSDFSATTGYQQMHSEQDDDILVMQNILNTYGDNSHLAHEMTGDSFCDYTNDFGDFEATPMDSETTTLPTNNSLPKNISYPSVQSVISSMSSISSLNSLRSLNVVC